MGEAIIYLLGRESGFAETSAYFARHGWLLILVGAFTPLPYKITVVTAGVIGVGFVPLLVMSIIGRIARFGLVAAIVRYRANTKLATLLVSILLLLVAGFWWWIDNAPI